MIRVVTLNCWKDEGDLAARLPVIASGLAVLGADIICLQEVYSGVDVCVARQLAQTLSLSLAAHPARAKVRRGMLSTSGLAILSPWMFTIAEALELPTLAADGQRIAQRVELDGPCGRIGVLNLHLSHLPGDAGADIRAQQINAAAEWALRAQVAPCIVAGDFNASLHSTELEAFRQRFAPDFGEDGATHAASTLHGCAGDPIDHVGLLQCAPGWQVGGREIVLDRPDRVTGVWPSDHVGVSVTFLRRQ